MFNVGGGELLLICVLALVVVGPEQLPGLLRKLGKYAGQAKHMSDSLRAEFMSSAEPFQESIREFQKGMNDFSNTVTENADVRNWGAGTADDPIVPRGFADQASSQLGAESSSEDAEAITAPDRPKKLELTAPVNPWAPLPGSGADSSTDPTIDTGSVPKQASEAGTVMEPGIDTGSGTEPGSGTKTGPGAGTEPTVDEQAEAAAQQLANRGRERTVIPPIPPFSSFPPADNRAGDST